MKDQYFGDINDYLKYGVLRCLGEIGFRLRVCWMLTPNDGRSDGRKTRYLTQPGTWRIYDPQLFDTLAMALKNNIRTVQWVQDKNLIPNSFYFNSVVPDDLRSRQRWIGQALFDLNEIDLIFFDPDNGIEIKSIPPGKRSASKFIRWDEIRMAAETERALLIFQHFCREDRSRFVSRLKNQLRELLPNNKVVAMRTANVVFFLVYTQSRQSTINAALQLISTRWAGQITLS